MRIIKFLELACSRHTPLRDKRLLVLLGQHGRKTTKTLVRERIADDHHRAIWRGIIRKAT